MLGMGKRYRVVLRGEGGGVRAWSAQTRNQALARFGQRVAAGGFSPWDGQRLMVVSEEEWAKLGGPELVIDGGGEELVGASAGGGSAGGARRLFGLFSRSKP
ncbi:hypothetical protein [Rugosimonospora africana]|uniref:Uncharacterized protein n=1 Tax=Rugosimonospora africana TaxID=556532 RepID=A0A8J3R3S3_9ACTN|nr:hypothetical protein [Rugosimonospora africana]GIH20855.1 hypothetical protein Raf01_90270 [Rugosimonospora africana]